MEITEWTQDLNLGIEIIDSQHRRIVDYINDLTHAIIAENQAEVADVLERLRDYTFDPVRGKPRPSGRGRIARTP